jgi:PAS domain S-box-containing protein
MVREQLDQQAWAQVEQGENITRILLGNRKNDLNQLALLTAQRPTLQDLLVRDDREALPGYMETLRAGAGLDLIVLCDLKDEIIAQAGIQAPGSICAASNGGEIFVDRENGQARAWLLSAQAVARNMTQLGTVKAGLALDNELASQIGEQTGVEQVYFVGGDLVASSLAEPAQTLVDWTAEFGSASASKIGRGTFSAGDQVYYGVGAPALENGFSFLVASSVENQRQAQLRLTRMMLAGILLVALVGSSAGVFIARQINRPLGSLVAAADSLRMGDLNTPVTVQTGLREIAKVSSTLEDARSALQHSLAQLQEEKAWVENLLESIVEGIVTLDQYGRITYFSRGAERITGVQKEEALMRSCDQVFHPLEENARFSQLLPLPGGRGKILLRLKDGSQATIAVTGARLAPPDAGKARLALVLRDISSEEVMRRLLGEFLANISHEFRTPLSALAASIELMLDQLPDLNQAELQELMTSVQLGVLNLQTLIDNLLEGASIETGRFKVSPRVADLKEIVSRSIETMEPLARKYGQSMQVRFHEEIPLVLADARRTGQVLVNLISNAIKYNPPGGLIDVSTNLEGGFMRISVADQGQGLPAVDIKDLFVRFVRLEDENRRAEHGAGLGLSVVKAIVEAQGGEVGAQNREGGGALFWFTIPLALERIPE